MKKEDCLDASQVKAIIHHGVPYSLIRNHCNVCYYTQKSIYQPVPLIMCIKCLVTVHIQCYYTIDANSPQKSYQSWLCDRCSQESVNPLKDTINCKFCPHKWGAFKKFVLNQEYFWGHAICIALNSAIYINQKSCCAQGINQLVMYNKKQQQQMMFNKCDICNNILGYAMKCDQDGCMIRFHALCWFLTVKEGAEFENFTKLNKNYYFQIFCGEHSEKKIEQFLNLSDPQLEQDQNQSQGQQEQEEMIIKQQKKIKTNKSRKGKQNVRS